MWMILRIRFLSIGRMLLDLRPAKDPSSIECVRLACSTVPPRRRAVHIIRAETITYAQLFGGLSATGGVGIVRDRSFAAKPYIHRHSTKENGSMFL